VASSNTTSRGSLRKRRAFLAAYAEYGSIRAAAKAAGMDRSNHYEWMKDVPGYAAAFEEADARSGDALEDEATRRAHEGVLQAEWYQGKAVGTKRVFSDGLMMFLLRGKKPNKYRQNVELTGANGGPVQSTITVRFVRPGNES